VVGAAARDGLAHTDSNRVLEAAGEKSAAPEAGESSGKTLAAGGILPHLGCTKHEPSLTGVWEGLTTESLSQSPT